MMRSQGSFGRFTALAFLVIALGLVMALPTSFAASGVFEYFFNETPSGELGYEVCPPGQTCAQDPNGTLAAENGEPGGPQLLGGGTFGGGNGSAGNPYQIEDWKDLNATRNNLAAYYILMANLSSSTPYYAGLGSNWTPIGDCGGDWCYGNLDLGNTPGDEGSTDHPFAGSFNGNGYTISNLEIHNTMDGVGLFGYVRNGNLFNIRIANVNMTGRRFFGGLVGYLAFSNITNSSASANITAPFGTLFGGLAGFLRYSSITNSSSETNIICGNSSGSIGGLAGYNYHSSIINSSSTANIRGGNNSGDVGGLVGVQESSNITNSNSIANLTGEYGSVSFGGLVGVQVDYSNITNSSSTANIVGGNNTGGFGGLVGDQAFQCNIINSSPTATLIGGSGSYSYGGLVGKQQWVSNIINSSSTATLIGGSGSYYYGGLVGYQPYSSNIVNSSFTGSVSGGSDIGGLVGYNYQSNIQSSYAVIDDSATLSGTTAVYLITHNNGGIINDTYGTVRNLFYGNVTFLSWDVSGTGNLTGNITVGNNYAFVNSTAQSGFNKPANVTLYNTTVAGGIVYRDNSVCPGSTCTDLTQIGDGDDYRFSVTGWSNYTIGLPCPNSMLGNGTEEAPCQIANWTDLNAVRNNLAAYYDLMNDLNTSGDYAGLGDNWTPIGNNINYFTGNFNGGNNTISNLTINLPSNYYVGLFGYATGNISDLGLVNVNVTGSRYVGGLIGRKDNGATSNSYSTGNVNGSSHYVGGLIGFQLTGAISDSHSTAGVTGVGYSVGGLVGEQLDGTISDSYTTGNVTGSDWDVGGLAGYQDDGTISDSYATGNVTGVGYVGGLIGEVYGDISNSHSTGEVYGAEGYVGGFAGGSGGDIFNSSSSGNANGFEEVGGFVGELWGGTISNCSSSGDANGSSYVGGLVGWQDRSYSLIFNSSSSGNANGSSSVGGLVGEQYWGAISNSYSTGNVFSSGDYAGGLVGWQDSEATISDSYSTGNVAGSNDVGGLVGHAAWEINRSYSTGNVTGVNNVGGLIGYKNDYVGWEREILDSYSIIRGTVSGDDAVGALIGLISLGDITNSYSIVETSATVNGGSNVGFIGLNEEGIITDSYLTIRNTAFGNITFLSWNVTGTGNLTGNITVGDNYAFVNSTAQPGFNVSANITLDLTNWSISIPPVILKEGIACSEPDCYLLFWEYPIIVFNATEWSNYTIEGYTSVCGNNLTEACEECDGEACCNANCTFKAAATVCMPSAGVCDITETCTGSNATCPADVNESDGAPCDDSDSCTQADTCQSGTCTGASPVICSALDQCHMAGTCNPSTGICTDPVKSNGTSCSDSDSCTSPDTCQSGVCVAGSNTCRGGNPCRNVNCDDSNPCTDDSCDDGDCVYEDNIASCSDNSFCTENDICSGGTCSGTAILCNDNNVCTTDSCSSSVGCVFTNNAVSCSDNNNCTRGDYCEAGTCQPGDDQCSRCNEPWACGEWGSCVSGLQSRTCECACDNQRCLGDEVTEQACIVENLSQQLMLNISAEKEVQVGEIIHVNVTDGNGVPVTAKITLVRPDGTKAEVSGEYAADQPGVWRIGAVKAGYLPAGANVSVKEMPEPPKGGGVGDQIGKVFNETITFVTADPIRFALLLVIVSLIISAIVFNKLRKKRLVEKI